jgi:cyclic beta-1,2-glucan glucanotransferase
MDSDPDQIATTARELREQHRITSHAPQAIAAWQHIDEMAAWLVRARACCAAPEPEATKAAEWLLDNDYQVLRSARQIRQDLPRAFYARLPPLAGPEHEALPRVFCLAHGLLRACRLQVSLAAAVRFVQAYQEEAPLTIAELWAFPTMLRLACLELLVAGFARLVPKLRSPFALSPCVAMLGPMDDTESVSRALANLVVIASISWKDFFDSTSHIEAILQGDPANVYARMDFGTRDRYRNVVEELADDAACSETDVARQVVGLAQASGTRHQSEHVGHWLIGRRRGEVEAALGYRPSLVTATHRWMLHRSGWLYASALVITGVTALLPPALYLAMVHARPSAWAVGLLLAVLPASILSVAVVHWLVTLLVPPRVLPKLDLEQRIPPECATAVVMPVIIGSTAEVPGLIERLELHWLASPDPTLRFVLLSDHTDAPAEHMPGDGAVAQVLVDGIRRLNGRYGQGLDGPFHLLHRARRFNPAEGCWMGWERKRGKLEQFNHLVLGDETPAFPLQEGKTEALHGVRFVVTVDADTTLPPGTVNRLVSALAHPLNSAERDAATGRVRSGYTVIQPRVEIRPESSMRSLFARLATGDTAIDIYSRAVSDVYQDLFGAGSYVGKGIYEVAPFQLSLEARVPENALLSHDLFEGAHGRVALASDIVVYEGFPAGYLEYSHRWHRWVRGDWQLLPWLFRRVPDAQGQRVGNSLPVLERWKILDNLRRSLIPLALVAFAVAGWLVLPGSAWVWTFFTLAPLGVCLVTEVLSDLARGRPRGMMRGTLRRFTEHAGRWGLAIVFLIQDAAIALDAIARTLWRLLVSRQHLLEWTSTAHSAVRFAAARTRVAAWRALWISPAVAVACAALMVFTNPWALLPASPILLLWIAAPEIAVWTSRSPRSRRPDLTADERAYLRRLARRTWLYFETFAGPEDNWLPPDNFQEQPHAELAHRTSPTNVGMMFLSTITAWDFGYLGSSALNARVHAALDTLDRLEQYRGHFLNWYDTRLLHSLEPRYVSTVDSGNLAVCLVTLKECCLEAADAPGLRSALWDGLADTLGLLVDALERAPRAATSELRATVAEIAGYAATVRADPGSWRTALARICERQCPELESMIAGAIARPQPALSAGSLRELRVWLERVHHHLAAMQRDLDSLYPWLALMDTAPPACADLVRGIQGELSPTVPLAEAGDVCARVRATVAATAGMESDPVAARWRSELDAAIARSELAQGALREGLRAAAARADAMAAAMEFGLLYDPESRLFHIGYNASSDRIDPHHYDLFASEARLASYFAIAKRDVPAEHWFFLGRPISSLPSGLSLVSWNGSMFEYLMPTLLLRGGPETLMARSEQAAVDTQRRYARSLGIPWGVSESAYAVLDADQHYQYHAFGVPGLGLRRGLARDRVVTPYASALALAVRPGEAVRNLRELDDLGVSGTYGAFEAADFTPERAPVGYPFAIVRSYMVHHQGMILGAIGNALHDDALVTRLRRDPRMRAIELLLEERVPWELPPEPVRDDEQVEPTPQRAAIPAPFPWAPSTANGFPQMHVLGNGRLATWISEAGAGALWWRRQALTRWLPDATRDDHGLWIYARDEDSGAVWSVGRQPCGIVSDDARVVFHAHLAEFHRRDHGIAIGMAVGIVPGDDVEIRRVTVANDSDRPRVVRLSSYGEVVLAPPLDDERHPAFSKMFVGGEQVARLNGLLFTRRPRSPHDTPPVLLHRVVFDKPDVELAGFDTDRRSFLGRSGDPRRPRGIVEGLAGTVGWTLDPIMSLQVRLELEPQERRQFAFLTMVSGSRESVLELAERYAELAALDWALGDAAAEAAREAQRLGLEPERLPEVATLASLLIHPHETLRAAPAEIAANRLGQPRLWGLGISGDLPILLLRASDQKEMGVLQLLVRAQRLWRRHGLQVDLVILRIGVTGYEEPVRERLLALLREGGAQELPGRDGGIHLVFSDQIHDDDRRLLEAVARVVLDEAQGSLAKQLERAAEPRPVLPRFEPTGAPPVEPAGPMLARPTGLVFANDLGGFTEDGREYVIHLDPGAHTPAPWCNVLANDEFGSLVTEAGGGYTWAVNSGENRLTAWTNDPVADPPSEAVYLRDEETGGIWTPTPAPAGADASCQIRHGAGYTTWRQHSHGFEQELLIFVPPDQPVKVARLRLRNLRPRGRRITATYYAEWLLGALRSVAGPHVVCDYDPECQALFARNPWNPDFAERVAFLTSSHPPHSLTSDRQDFLGREGSPGRPAGLLSWDLGGRIRPGGDPCAALQVHLELAAGGETEVVFILGQGRDRAHAAELAQASRQAGWADRAFEALGRCWEQRLGAVRVRTPDAGFDLLANRWLLYQTFASRVLARAGFYQAGGALGFRDQLQDILALFHADPARARAHIVASAARQFEEGDVLHWWHPPQDRGVRTRCSDDLLWLPYVTSRYVEATGDVSILAEDIPFLHAAPLLVDEDDRYARFETGSEHRSLFEHCQRALERGDTRGAHGLPLMGAGDWNDGMNRVGAQGRGESVWLAWFAIATMRDFAGLAARMGRDDLVERWTHRAEELRETIERTAWDGHWYVRAFADDGRPWGAAAFAECRIDSISQSWAVLAGAGVTKRARAAVAAAARELVRGDDRIVRLLWPPFDETSRDPGYIKAYPPGIRENGGQYTHAAAWLGLAYIGLGDGDRAWEIFDLLSPIRHAASRADADHYRVEPYVLAADIASVAPHTGQGGWTWYTGSAAWTLRLGIEGILGLQLRNGELLVDPCLPKAWGRAEAEIRGPAGALSIRIEDPEHVGRGVVAVTVDGVAFAGPAVGFPTDGSLRRVAVRLGRPSPPQAARTQAPRASDAIPSEP